MHANAFTPNNAAMILIDHQVGTMAWTHSHDINLVKQNALKLARIAKALDLPTVLTSSMEDQVQGPLVPELQQIVPEAFAAPSNARALSMRCTTRASTRPSRRPDARSSSSRASPRRSV
jgi:nicotinamidase-related amidase